MDLSKAIVEILKKEGITDAFGIPGAGCNALYAALDREREHIHHITMRHEECCVHAAAGYYRASGKMALAVCTSGPGATNFTTGLYTANIDSIPLIAITGQAVRSQLGKDAFQCVDIAAITAPVTKLAVCLTDPKTAVNQVIEAVRAAKSGKPGPVLLDIPLDMQKAEVAFDPNIYVPVEIQKPRADTEALKAALDMLLEAENPIILMGGGVVLAGAEALLVEFAELMNIPVAITYMAKGAIAPDHPLYAGMPGIQCGDPAGNALFAQSDVVLAIGNRFTDRHTGDIGVYSQNRRFIHINIEKSEIGKILTPDLGIAADARDALEQLLKLGKSLGRRSGSRRAEGLAAVRDGMKRKVDQAEVPINPHRVFGEMNRAFGPETMFTTGCGITQIWSGQLQEISRPRKYLPSGGAGCLGWDIPGAIGAMVSVKNEDKCVCVMGDFGFTFHAQELATAAVNGIPLIVCIVNNAYLGLIRQNQKFAYGYEYGVAMPENQEGVDYVKVAEGFGCGAERVFRPEELPAAFQRAKGADRPYVIDIVCEPQAHCSMGNDILHVKEFNAE